MALSSAGKNRRRKNGRGNLAGFSAALWPSARTSPQKRLLKGELKIAHRTEALRKDRAQMFHGVAERIGLKSGRGFLPEAQTGAQFRQTAAQTLQEMINRLQRKRQTQFLGGSFDADIGQQLKQEPAQQRGADGVAWQNIRQKNRKSLAATAATEAIGTKDPLAPRQEAAVIFGRIVAVKEAVPIQRFLPAAAWTALLFERKSSSFSFSRSRTKRNFFSGMGGVAAGTNTARREFFDGTFRRRDSVQKGQVKQRDGTDGASTAFGS